MQVDIELLPAITAIISNTEKQLARIIGTPVKLKMRLLNDEINETFLQTLVCEEFDVKWPDLLSPSRKAELVAARQVYWWLCRKYTGATVTKLGSDFGKDHTTVLYALQRVNDLIDTKDDTVLPKLKEIEKSINA
jgi:chromosomal replication initiation ATPase DnaA